MTLRGCAGFTLVELLVSAALASIGFLGLAALHANSLRTVAFGRDITIAITLATQEIEDLRRTPAASLADVGAQSITVGHRAYTRSATVSAAPIGTGKQVRVDVSWSNQFGSQTFRLDSVIGQ
jgi:prepilin-type N-terminal cleavage/methylation domain-containing protein